MSTNDSMEPTSEPTRKTRRSSKLMMIFRRVHLYAGLFLLPWVFLFGITGAMFNHQSLFPDALFQTLGPATLGNSPMTEYPSPGMLAHQVVNSINDATDDASVRLADDHGAEFTNNVMFEVNEQGQQHIIHIDPVSHASFVITRDKVDRKPKKLLSDLGNIQLEKNPMVPARQSVPIVLSAAGIQTQSQPKPFGWTKLNFLASVDGAPARITYVLKDGHVDVTEYSGKHAMTTRGFFMRLHTTHGQPPHWNGRMFWTLIADAMAIAMVTWGLTGLLMWWQIKRTRLMGGLVMLASLITAVALYLAAYDFYATTTL